MKARTSSSVSEQPEVGTHFARLVGIADMGHQPGYEYKGEQVQSKYALRLTYELVNSAMSDGRPFWVHETVTNSDNEKSTLALRVRTLKGSFDKLTSMLGNPCSVTIEHDKKGYAKIAGQGAVGAVPNGIEVAPLRNNTFVFDLNNPDLAVFENFPEFIKNKIKENLDYEGSPLQLMLDQAQPF